MGDPGGAAVRFAVLGPLRTWRGDAGLSLGSVQQRVVLAVLLLHANRPVGREQLLNAVWGSAAPASAVNLLARHAAGLRRVVEPARAARAASGLLTWTDAGYLLRVPEGGLDLAVFDRQLGRARAARTAGDLAGAAAALHAAEGLWRGPAFDGLASPLLDAERERLAERRIGAVEERIEVELALGDGGDLVGELRRLVAEHPLRERLRGLLMLALYRCGRQGEALAAFAEARRQLVGELGVEPAAPLQRLHRQILAADPALVAPPATGNVPTGVPTEGVPTGAGAGIDGGPPVPAQLPHGLADFTGRAAELARLDQLLEAAGGRPAAVVISAVSGTAGVGKTALAIHWAHQVADRFGDGQLYVNLRGFDPTGSVMDPAEAVRGFLDAFGVSPQRIPAGLDAQAGMYRSLLAGKRVQVVLDNARDAEQVRALLPGAPGCLALVTSRNQLPGLVAAQGAQPIALDLLSAAEARDLLARRLGPNRVAAEPDATDEIIALCARLPLALTIVAARAATHPGFPLAVLAGELRDARGGLDAFTGDDPATDARAVFSWSYQRLSPEAARLFRLLGLHPGPDVATPAAASLAGIPPRQVHPVLAELTRAHLVTEHPPGRFGFHDLLRAYATEMAHNLDTDTDRRAALHRVLDHYLHTAHNAALQLGLPRDVVNPPAPQAAVVVSDVAGHGQALAWFTAEHSVLLAAVDQAADTGFDVHAWQLAWALSDFFDRRGHWHDLAAIQRVALDATRRLADPIAQTRTHSNLARAYARLGRLDDAQTRFQRALDLHRERDDLTGQAGACLHLGWVLERRGSHAEALRHALRALELYRVAGDRFGQANALSAVGWDHALLGNYQQALTYCRQALALLTEIGDRHGQAAAWDSLGYAHHHSGQHASAVVCYQRAVDLLRDIGSRYNEAHVLIHLGDTHHTAGHPEPASQAWQQALTILDHLDHPEAAQVRAKLKDLDRDRPTTPTPTHLPSTDAES
jgi:DNA-binding SARP family transcriptional activator/tetratricopeptide (TPR) repeat protein